MTEPSQEEPKQATPPSKWIVTLTVLPIIVLTIIANIGARTWFSILPDNPALALAMNPTNVVMAAASSQLSTFEYYSIVIVRRLLVDPCYVLLGVWYGHRAIGWLKRRSRDLGPLAEKLEEWFPKYGSILILVNQHALLFLLAGSSGMRMRKIMALDFIGTVVTAYVVRRFADRFSNQVGGFTDFLKDNQPWFLGLSAVLLLVFAVQMYQDRDQTRPSEIEEELEGEEASDSAKDEGRDR